MKFKSFEDLRRLAAERKIALSAAEPKIGRIAANDNRPRKERPARYRGTLPALKWLFDHHAELAIAFAKALPKSDTTWTRDVDNIIREIRPTVGELMEAASDAFRVFVRDGVRHVGKGMQIAPKANDDIERITLGSLKFRDGLLVEWAVTKKGRKLRPVDRLREGGTDKTSARNPRRYLSIKTTAPSPFLAKHLHRPISDEPALAPMYDPLPRMAPNAEDKHGRFGVAEARAVLEAFGVDGSVPFEELPIAALKCADAVASGAGFLGGVSRLSGNSSSGAVLWDMPEKPEGKLAIILDEVAARGTLTSIGIRLGYSKDYADRGGKAALIEVARTLKAANDNKKIADDVPQRAAL